MNRSMRNTSKRRVAKSSQPHHVNQATLYSKQSRQYFPRTDNYFIDDRKVPAYTEEEAAQRGLATAGQFAEHIGCSRGWMYQWLRLHEFKPDAVIIQPRYGKQRTAPERLYSIEKVFEQFKRTPMKKIPRKEM